MSCDDILNSKLRSGENFFLHIFSGQVHIISSDRDDSEDEFVAAASPPRMMDLRPNTKELDVSIYVLSCDEISAFEFLLLPCCSTHCSSGPALLNDAPVTLYSFDLY
jgi:hypothetical protein